MKTPPWKLADYFEPVGDEQEFPEYLIATADDLRNHLRKMVGEHSRIVELYSPGGDFLRIGIGGRFAGLALIRMPSVKIVLSAKPVAAESMAFEIQGQPSTLKPDELHAPETVIELACQFFTHGRLPESLVYR